ncbi:MAG TPA: glycoside hydrolase family 2 protein [bacterium]|nr:glycoside hydrolase family 2 protein [bacterium]
MIQSLDGQWMFRLAGALKGKAPRNLGLNQWMPAQMPGTVHYQLQKLGKIADPFYGRNELEVQWVDEQDWELRRSFEATAGDCAKARRQLIFDGIDTIAEIFLNGKRVGKSINMFRQVVCDLGTALKSGTNEIRVLLKSPTAYAWGEARRHRYQVNTDPDFKWETGEARESRRAWIRKVQCQFGWDWGLYLAVSGLWQPTRLECSNAPRLASLQTRQTHLGPTGNPRQVRLRFTARLEASRPTGGELQILCGGKKVRVSARLNKGENQVAAEIVLDQPRLWWPSGQGEQPLYPVEVVWLDESGETSKLHKKIGLRTLELVTQKGRSKDGKPAQSFYFKVNGRPVFMKGANWIPPDAFSDRCTPAVYRHLLSSMKEAHMNMVRVWGGGWYEQEFFYNLCDEMGILVWQDFMMACAVYPGTSEFIHELTEEARYQVRRLSDHACLALWSGDNENLSGIAHWWWTKIPGGKRYPAMYRRYMSALRDTCEKEDPTRRFWLSSPSNGAFNAGDPDDLNRGDVHYWKVWHGGRPFSDYLTVKPRFVSEFGFQSFPEPRTLTAVVPKKEMNPSSWVMEHHQRSPKGNLLITNTLAREMPIPKDFDSFCYASQINQAMAIRTAVEHWRRLKPWCMGTLYWQVNDLWPVASWSSMDYHGRWKVLHHEAARFYSPLLASLEVSEKTLSVWATSDSPKAVNLKGRLESFTWGGRKVKSLSVNGRLKAGESRKLLAVDFARLLEKGMHPREIIVFIRLEGPGIHAENHAILVPWKWAPVEKPRLQAALRNGQNGLELAVQTHTVVPFFHAELQGLEGHFAGDWRVLRPGAKYNFPWVAHTERGAFTPGLAEVRSKLKTLSLYDLVDHPRV